MGPFWLSAFLDFAADDFEDGCDFWRGVTGFELSPARGEDEEFATLVPPVGDDYLRVQRLASGPARIHLDLHVPDPRAAADAAITWGAEELADREEYVVLRSPGGLVFCFVTAPASTVPAALEWPGGYESMVYQVCLDLPVTSYDDELRFWANLLDARVELLEEVPEFSWLRMATPMALDVLVQRLGRADGPTSVHLDVGSTDRAKEVARHVGLGAIVVGEYRFWTVLRDPVGMTYCITDRDPSTRTLPA